MNQEIPEPQRREVPKYYESGAIMQTVRNDIKYALKTIPAKVTKTQAEEVNQLVTNSGLIDNLMDSVECSAWKKFDLLKAQGAFTKKVYFIPLDGSSIVEKFLKMIFGSRPLSCI